VVLDNEQDDAGRWSARVHRCFADAIASYPRVQCVSVDMPIGLLEGGARQCDLEARKPLGPKRSSSFAAPDPRLFGSTTRAEATARSDELTGVGISQQAFGLYPKVAATARNSGLGMAIAYLVADTLFASVRDSEPFVKPGED
jgi:predicted RNase H-like nuclease